MNFLSWPASRTKNRGSSYGSKWSKIFSRFGKPADDNPRAVAPAPPESEHQAKGDVPRTTDTPRQRRASATEEPDFGSASRPDEEMKGIAAHKSHDSKGPFSKRGSNWPVANKIREPFNSDNS